MEADRSGINRGVSTGFALAVTVGIAYAACALVFRLWPDGLDFRKLQAGAAMFDFGTFFFALTVLVVWAFALGFIFGWIADRLRAGR